MTAPANNFNSQMILTQEKNVEELESMSAFIIR